MSIVVQSRTEYSIEVSWSAPSSSTTTVLGYRVYINDPNSNDFPSILVYDGKAIPSILTTTIYNLQSGKNYLIGYTVLNRAGWSSMSPTLNFVAGKLPAPPQKPP